MFAETGLRSRRRAQRKRREEEEEEEEKKEEKRREREKGRWCLQIAIESGRLEISNGALKAEKEKQPGETTEHRNTMVSDPFEKEKVAWLGLA